MALDLSGLKLPPGVTPDMLQVQQAPPPPLTVEIQQFPLSAFALEVPTEEGDDVYTLRMEVPVSPNSKKELRFPFSKPALRMLYDKVQEALDDDA